MNVVYVVNVGRGYGGEESKGFRALSDLDFLGAVVCRLSGQRTRCTLRSWEVRLRSRGGPSFTRPRRDPVPLTEPIDLRQLLRRNDIARACPRGPRRGRLVKTGGPLPERARYCRESRDSIRTQGL